MTGWTLKIKQAKGRRYKSVRCSCCGLPRVYPSLKLAKLDAAKYNPWGWKASRTTARG